MSVLSPTALAALLAVRFHGTTLPGVLEEIVAIAKEHIPPADEVSVTLVRDGKPFTAAYTGKLALVADELQYERGYGPCVDAGLSATTMHVDDMRVETRWPDYAAKVVPEGVLSSLSVPLPVQTEFVGALNCYARTPGAFTRDAMAMADEVASHIAVAVANAVSYSDAEKRTEEMRAAMSTRAVIDQAIGVIMAQNRCDSETAFAILRRASQHRNRKLREIAQEIVTSISAGA